MRVATQGGEAAMPGTSLRVLRKAWFKTGRFSFTGCVID
jgi:hypothetical protein